MPLLRYDSCRYLLEDVTERDRAAGVGTLLEAAECSVELFSHDRDAELGARAGEGVTPRVLAERKRHPDADVLRIDDLVRARVLQHPVLVDAGLVRERVCADDRLVR